MKKLLLFFLALFAWLGISAEKYPGVIHVAGDATSGNWLNADPRGLLYKTDINKYVGFVSFVKDGEVKFLCQADWKDMWGAPSNGDPVDAEGTYNISFYSNGNIDNKYKSTLSGLYLVTIDATTEGSETITFKAWNDEQVMEIASGGELNAFAYAVNKFKKNLKGKLTGDIASYGADKIGENDGNSFEGTFDGQGHKITVNYPEAGAMAGLFRAIKNATIENLYVDGTINAGDHNLMGGLVNESRENSVLRNIVVAVNMTSTHSGDGTHGGVISVAWGAPTIENVAFIGSINAPSDEGSCGLIGYAHSGGSIHYKNCYVTGTLDLKAGNNRVFGRNGEYCDYCYTTLSMQMLNNNERGGKKVDASIVSTGELAFLLNGGVTGGDKWYQTIGTDATPVPFSTSGKVYITGHKTCNGEFDHSEYKNTDDGVTQDDHAFTEGVCTACYLAKEDYMTPDDGVYSISTAAQLKWFARYVCTRNGRVNAKLANDIDYKAYTDQLAMIGAPQHTFQGTFDGQNHTVTVAFNNTAAEETALFRRINGGTVKNLKVDGTITTNKKLAGGIASGIWETGTIQNCESAVIITDNGIDDATHGGILAAVHDNTANGINITNCLFSGTLDIQKRTGSGAIIGWPNHGSANVHVKNCLVTGTLNMKADSDNDVICRNEADVQNCYYINLQGANNSKSATAATSAQAESGELCYLLNGNVNGGENWFQKKGVDNVPTPFATGDNKIYANGSQKCDGTPKATTYDNTNTGLVKDDHVFAANNLCEKCHKAGEEPSKVAEVYQIATIGHLVWFAEHVNGGATTAAADVTADIAQGEAIYTPIGSQANPYKGVFKGGFHTITLALDNDGYNNQGIFGVLTVGAEIYNLTAAGSVKGAQGVGGIAGSTTGGDKKELVQFINCGNEAVVEATNENAGGILGVDMGSGAHVKMINCYNAGTIKGKDSGGLSGWAGDNADVINCYAIGEVQGVDGDTSDPFCRVNGADKYNNTFGKNQISDGMLSSGELCYRLGDLNFRQEIGTDAHPVLSSTKPMVRAYAVPDNDWSSYVPDADVILTAYAVTEIKNGYVKLAEVSSAKEGEAVLVKDESAEGQTTHYINTGEAGENQNLLKSSGADGKVVEEGEKCYVLAGTPVAFHPVNAGSTIRANKAYLEIPAGQPAPAKLRIGGQDEETAIEGVIVEKLDGTTEIYNVAGQKLMNLQKGINIVNGKKIMVK